MDQDLILNESGGLLQADISIGSISLEKKALFAKNMAILLKSGLTIAESLFIIIDQSSGKMKSILISVLRSVEAGNSLSSALARFPKVFSDMFVNTTLAGEKSGNLDSNFENIAEKLHKDKELVSKIQGALFYPMFILLAALGLGISVTFFVLPKILPMFQGMGMKLPFTTRMLIAFSDIMQAHKTAILLTIFVGGGLVFWLARQRFAQPVVDYLILRMPIIKNISRNSNLTNFCRTLGTLLRSGLHIDEALYITRDTMNNYYYKKCITVAVDKILQGNKMSNELKRYEDLFPKMTISMIQVGENSGKLEESLLFLAGIYEEEVDAATKNLSKTIEPVLLVGIGLMVGVLALSIISPIYQITGSIQGGG